MKKRKTIKERVLIDIFNIWDEKGVEFARNELQKMYLSEYYTLTDIEDKRLILHNLAVAEMEIGEEKGLEAYEMNSVKQYTSILKKDMDDIKGYKEDNGCLYARVLANYAESNKKELPKDELIEIYEFCYYIYEKYDDTNENGCLAKLVAQFNLNLVKGNFKTVFKIVEDMLHNKDLQYEKILQQFLKNIKEVNEGLYNKLLLMKQEMQFKIS